MEKINRDEIELRIEAAIKPIFETADKRLLGDKVYALVCDDKGRLAVVQRDEINNRYKIANVTEMQLYEKLRPKEWEKLIVKAAIYLEKIGLYDRGVRVSEKKQMVL